MSLQAITTLRRQLHEWAERGGNRKFLQHDQEAQLDASIGVPQRRTQTHVAAWMLGTWHLGHGMLRVLDGDGEGFDEARLGQGLRRTSLLLRAGHQDQRPSVRGRSGSLPFSRLHGTWTALLGLALHDPGADPLYDLLRDEPEASFPEDEPLPLFTRALLILHAGEKPTLTPRLGPYQEALMHWHGDGRLFAQHLATLLDLHLERTQPAGAPFDDPGCKLYPVEVLAVRSVREWLSLPMPKVDHPLMHGNLVQMAPSGPWPKHERLQRLERELRRR